MPKSSGRGRRHLDSSPRSVPHEASDTAQTTLPKPAQPPTPPRRRRSSGRNAFPTTLAAKHAHDADAEAVSDAVSILERVMSALQTKAAVPNSPRPATNDPAVSPSPTPQHRDFTSTDVVDVISELIDEHPRPTLEYVLGLLGVRDLPDRLQDRQRSLGSQAFTSGFRNRVIRRKREALQLKRRRQKQDTAAAVSARSHVLRTLRAGIQPTVPTDATVVKMKQAAHRDEQCTHATEVGETPAGVTTAKSSTADHATVARKEEEPKGESVSPVPVKPETTEPIKLTAQCTEVTKRKAETSPTGMPLIGKDGNVQSASTVGTTSQNDINPTPQSKLLSPQKADHSDTASNSQAKPHPHTQHVSDSVATKPLSAALSSKDCKDIPTPAHPVRHLPTKTTDKGRLSTESNGVTSSQEVSTIVAVKASAKTEKRGSICSAVGVKPGPRGGAAVNVKPVPRVENSRSRMGTESVQHDKSRATAPISAITQGTARRTSGPMASRFNDQDQTKSGLVNSSNLKGSVAYKTTSRKVSVKPEATTATSDVSGIDVEPSLRAVVDPMQTAAAIHRAKPDGSNPAVLVKSAPTPKESQSTLASLSTSSKDKPANASVVAVLGGTPKPVISTKNVNISRKPEASSAKKRISKFSDGVPTGAMTSSLKSGKSVADIVLSGDYSVSKDRSKMSLDKAKGIQPIGSTLQIKNAAVDVNVIESNENTMKGNDQQTAYIVTSRNATISSDLPSAMEKGSKTIGRNIVRSDRSSCNTEKGMVSLGSRTADASHGTALKTKVGKSPTLKPLGGAQQAVKNICKVGTVGSKADFPSGNLGRKRVSKFSDGVIATGTTSMVKGNKLVPSGAPSESEPTGIRSLAKVLSGKPSVGKPGAPLSDGVATSSIPGLRGKRSVAGSEGTKKAKDNEREHCVANDKPITSRTDGREPSVLPTPIKSVGEVKERLMHTNISGVSHNKDASKSNLEICTVVEKTSDVNKIKKGDALGAVNLAKDRTTINRETAPIVRRESIGNLKTEKSTGPKEKRARPNIQRAAANADVGVGKKRPIADNSLCSIAKQAAKPVGSSGVPVKEKMSTWSADGADASSVKESGCGLNRKDSQGHPPRSKANVKKNGEDKTLADQATQGVGRDRNRDSISKSEVACDSKIKTSKAPRREEKAIRQGSCGGRTGKGNAYERQSSNKVLPSVSVHMEEKVGSRVEDADTSRKDTADLEVEAGAKARQGKAGTVVDGKVHIEAPKRQVRSKAEVRDGKVQLKASDSKKDEAVKRNEDSKTIRAVSSAKGEKAEEMESGQKQDKVGQDNVDCKQMMGEKDDTGATEGKEELRIKKENGTKEQRTAEDPIEKRELEAIFGVHETTSKDDDSELNPIGKGRVVEGRAEESQCVDETEEGVSADKHKSAGGNTSGAGRGRRVLGKGGERKVERRGGLRRGSTTGGPSGGNSGDGGTERAMGTRRLRRESVNLRDAWSGVMAGDVLFAGDELMQECVGVWARVNQAKISIPFRDPVQAKDAPGYFDIVKEPMDLSTVRKRMEEKKVDTPRKFYHDMMLICHNALLFNDLESDIYSLALELKQMIRKNAKPVVRKWLSQHQKKDNGASSESSLSSSSSSSAGEKAEEGRGRRKAPRQVMGEGGGQSRGKGGGQGRGGRATGLGAGSAVPSRKRNQKKIMEREDWDSDDDEEEDDGDEEVRRTNHARRGTGGGNRGSSLRKRRLTGGNTGRGGSSAGVRSSGKRVVEKGTSGSGRRGGVGGRGGGRRGGRGGRRSSNVGAATEASSSSHGNKGKGRRGQKRSRPDADEIYDEDEEEGGGGGGGGSTWSGGAAGAERGDEGGDGGGDGGEGSKRRRVASRRRRIGGGADDDD